MSNTGLFGKQTLGLLIDLIKSFDCVNHDVLLLKLNSYGNRENANEGIRYYLSDQQQVVGNDVKSNKQLAKTGMAQGSIASPILFKTYIMISL